MTCWTKLKKKVKWWEKITRVRLATNAQVLQTAQYNSEDDVGGSDVIEEGIDEAEAEVTGTWGDPKRKVNFVLQSPNTKYEFRVDNKQTYRIDQVLIIENDNSRRTYTEADSGDDPSEDDQTYTNQELTLSKIFKPWDYYD